MDGTKVALVHLKLVAESFEEWICEKTNKLEEYVKSFKLLKTIGSMILSVCLLKNPILIV